MSAHCCGCDPGVAGATHAYCRTLQAVIAINATMFAGEVAAGLAAGSMALQADALDFLGDSATYGLSLWVIGKPARWRANAALIKAASLALLGCWILAATIWRVFVAQTPEPFVMGGMGLLALAANITSALLLLRFREGDANVRSVWICSRNDAIGNIAVGLAASGVVATDAAWPDLVVAASMASLFLASSGRITRQAIAERAAVATSLG